MSAWEPVEVSPDQETLDLDQQITVVVPYLPIELDVPSWDLPPFSGKDVTCPKCGLSENMVARYHDVVATYTPCHKVVSSDWPKHHQIGFPEHIDRRCGTCHYEWTEGTAEADVS